MPDMNIGSETAVISIHSLVKRETIICFKQRFDILDFNPLPRKEGDMEHFPKLGQRIISIHSLVKRETEPRLFRLVRFRFQSTPS